eukprot:COSAG01_NODE_4127_length_5326_cov_3.238569_10_plen_115_part_00
MCRIVGESQSVLDYDRPRSLRPHPPMAGHQPERPLCRSCSITCAPRRLPGGEETAGSGGRAGGGVCVVTALCPLALAQYGVSKGALLHPLTREPLNGTYAADDVDIDEFMPMGD